LARKPLTVCQLTTLIKTELELAFPSVLVEGEISNLSAQNSSGHIYFSLKDEKSTIRCTLWRTNRSALRFRLEDGQKIIIGGAVRLYDKAGQYQINVETIEPSGVGALQLAFEQLKAKLEKEGLFDAMRKRPLPVFPRRVGVVTSATGAAFKDICKVLHKRMPGTVIVLNPAQVQGDQAASDIARAIREFNEYGDVEVLIVGRGGGSTEDLWAFNEEAVARAIADSRIPIISAVGHEVDFTIADFVADDRAPTPSAAAMAVVPDRDELILQVKHMADVLAGNLKGLLRHNQERLKRLAGSFVFKRPQTMIEGFAQRLDDLLHMLEGSFRRTLESKSGDWKNATDKLNLLNPMAILSRGYSVTKMDGKILSSSRGVEAGCEIETILSDGKVKSKVMETEFGI